MDSTEEWCQERAIYLSLMESVKIADGQDTKRDKGAIPQILSEALGVCFDQHVEPKEAMPSVRLSSTEAVPPRMNRSLLGSRAPIQGMSRR